MKRAGARAAMLVAVIPALAWSAPPAKPDHPLGRFGFGRPATAEEIAGWNIDVRPDGTGLPPGRGSVAQGQEIYDAKCASCHGTFGESTDYIALAGGVGTLASGQPVRTTGSKLNYATTLFDYIRRAMPFPNPKSLNDDEVYALTAYVLNLNDIVPADAVLDRDSLPKVKMPNRDGFTTAHGFMTREGKPDTRNVACMHDCAGEVRIVSELPEHARDAHGSLAEQTRSIGPLRGVGYIAGSAASPLRAVASGPELAQQQGCLACHAVDHQVVGPAFREVARRYAGDRGASTRLAAKIRSGGSGAWGQVPMPAQPQVKEGEGLALVQWILSNGN